MNGIANFTDYQVTYASIPKARTEQLLLELARTQGPPNELDIQSGAVYARTTLLRGTKYGPYEIHYTPEPTDKMFAWEVSLLENEGIRAHYAYFAISSKLSTHPQNVFVATVKWVKTDLIDTEKCFAVFNYSSTVTESIKL